MNCSIFLSDDPCWTIEMGHCSIGSSLLVDDVLYFKRNFCDNNVQLYSTIFKDNQNHSHTLAMMAELH